jgi:hypothetical protein
MNRQNADQGRFKKSVMSQHMNIDLPDREHQERGVMRLLEHPLFGKSMILPTEPINEMVGAMRRTIMLREQGCCFTATSGFGKSFGLRMAEMQLRRMFAGVPIYRHIIDNQQVPSIRAFFKHFLLTVGIDDIKGETYDLRIRLVSQLEDVGRKSPMRMIVLLVDEAQEMALQDFKFLKDIGNHLETVDVQLVVIMIGQDPDFENTINKLKHHHRLDLVSRFTLRRLRFRGLQTREDFSKLLGLIDEQVFPPGSNCTWPEYFAPHAWKNGFRMQEQLNDLLIALEDVLPGGLAEAGVPARQLFLAVRRFLLDYAELDRQQQQASPDLWKRCVDYALIEDAALIAKGEGRAAPGRIAL